MHLINLICLSKKSLSSHFYFGSIIREINKHQELAVMDEFIKKIETLFPVLEQAFKEKKDWINVFNRIEAIIQELKFSPLNEEQKERVRIVIEKMIDLFVSEGFK